MGLVITRKIGERVRIGPNIWVTITRVKGEDVGIAIDAPRSVEIDREELLPPEEHKNPPRSEAR